MELLNAKVIKKKHYTYCPIILFIWQKFPTAKYIVVSNVKKNAILCTPVIHDGKFSRHIYGKKILQLNI
jgi:hypothetical protein